MGTSFMKSIIKQNERIENTQQWNKTKEKIERETKVRKQIILQKESAKLMIERGKYNPSKPIRKLNN